MRIHYVNCIETNRGWGVENFIAAGLIKLGHQVINTDYRKNRQRLGELLNAVDADVLFIQRGEWIPPVLISSVNYPKILWASELVSRNRDEVFYNACAFDFIFTHDESCREELKNCGIENTEVLLNGFSPTFHKKMESHKEYDVLFVGVMNDRRKRLIEELSSDFNVTYLSVFGEEMVSHVNKAKIVLNLHYADGILDTETRVYETLGCGQFLLSEELSMKVFRNGKHLVECSAIDDMKEKIAFYLENGEKREKIAEAGYKEANRKHTYFHRAEYIAAKMQEVIERIKAVYGEKIPEMMGIMYGENGSQTTHIEDFYKKVETDLSADAPIMENLKREISGKLYGKTE